MLNVGNLICNNNNIKLNFKKFTIEKYYYYDRVLNGSLLLLLIVILYSNFNVYYIIKLETLCTF